MAQGILQIINFKIDQLFQVKKILFLAAFISSSNRARLSRALFSSSPAWLLIVERINKSRQRKVFATISPPVHKILRSSQSQEMPRESPAEYFPLPGR